MDSPNSIDTFDIFELMGLNNLSNQDKTDFLSQIESNIWSEFLILRLTKILTEAQLTEVNKLIEQNQDLKVITNYIEFQAPNFRTLLFEYAREEKTNIIKKHFEELLRQPENLRGKGKETKKLQAALSLLDQEKWNDLKNLW